MVFDPTAGHIFRTNAWMTPADASFRAIINPADLSIVGRAKIVCGGRAPPDR